MSRQARRHGRLAVTWCLSVTPSALSAPSAPAAGTGRRRSAHVSSQISGTPIAGVAGAGVAGGSAGPPGKGAAFIASAKTAPETSSSTTGTTGATAGSTTTSQALDAGPRSASRSLATTLQPSLAPAPAPAALAQARGRIPHRNHQPGLITARRHIARHSVLPHSRPAAATSSRSSFPSVSTTTLLSPPRASSSSSLQQHLHGRRSYHVYAASSKLESSCSSAVLHLSPTLTRRRLRKLVVAMGHSHSHGGHSHGGHDNAYLVSAKKNDPGVRITRIGLLSNLLMAVAKFIGGWAFNSKAMVADAWHSIADMASDILTLATVSWSIKPPSDRFPLGFGKVESLGALGVSGMLLVGGVYMGWDSAISLFSHFNPEAAHHILEHVGHGHGHSHSHSAADLGIPSVHAAWLAGATILIKEWLYHATMKVARERKSSVLASNAVHHRVDSLTGIVTMFAIVGANVIENAAWLDPVGGLLISIMVIHAGFANTKSSLYELIDQTIDSDVKGSVRKQAQGALANVSDGHEAELRDVSGVKSGQNYLVDLEMAVPGAWTVDDLHEVENAVRTQVGAKVRGVRRVRLRFVSKGAPVNEKFDEFVYTNLDADPEGDHKHEDGANGDEHNHKH